MTDTELLDGLTKLVADGAEIKLCSDVYAGNEPPPYAAVYITLQDGEGERLYEVDGEQPVRGVLELVVKELT